MIDVYRLLKGRSDEFAIDHDSVEPNHQLPCPLYPAGAAAFRMRFELGHLALGFPGSKATVHPFLIQGYLKNFCTWMAFEEIAYQLVDELA